MGGKGRASVKKEETQKYTGGESRRENEVEKNTPNSEKSPKPSQDPKQFQWGRHDLSELEAFLCWFGSVNRASVCTPKGPRLDSDQGHMPGLRVRGHAGGRQSQILFIDVSLSLSEFNKDILKNSNRELGSSWLPFLN